LTKPEEVKRILTTKHVIQMGGSVNNMFGHGRLYLDADTDWSPSIPPKPNPPVLVDPENKNILICPNPVSLSVDSYVKIANFSQDVSRLEARIYNINGEFVRNFSILELQEELNRKTLRWDLRNENGSKVAPGIYFISIKTDSGKNQIRKIAIQK
ncbi:MAG: T9SS type A sorting domain-containing protein, partial [Endomicrobium sp.]|nr:T9SS type A sorting domain-containing protein [Endomicrobium sp.]